MLSRLMSATVLSPQHCRTLGCMAWQTGMRKNQSLNGSRMDCQRFWSNTWRYMIRSTNTLWVSVMTIMHCRKGSGTLNNGDCLLIRSRNWARLSLCQPPRPRSKSPPPLRTQGKDLDQSIDICSRWHQAICYRWRRSESRSMCSE